MFKTDIPIVYKCAYSCDKKYTIQGKMGCILCKEQKSLPFWNSPFIHLPEQDSKVHKYRY